LPLQEVRKYDDAIHIFRTKAEAETHNLKKLIELKNPIYRIESRNSPDSAKNTKED
jgi:hypothetical protein